MRWPSDRTPVPGNTRRVDRFLWWPVSLEGETRWLEKGSWQEEYMGLPPGWVKRSWVKFSRHPSERWPAQVPVGKHFDQ